MTQTKEEREIISLYFPIEKWGVDKFNKLFNIVVEYDNNEENEYLIAPVNVLEKYMEQAGMKQFNYKNEIVYLENKDYKFPVLQVIGQIVERLLKE